MLQGYTMAIVPCGNPTSKKLPTGGGEWHTFRTARAQRAHSARYAPFVNFLATAAPKAGEVVECVRSRVHHGIAFEFSTIGFVLKFTSIVHTLNFMPLCRPSNSTSIHIFRLGFSHICPCLD